MAVHVVADDLSSAVLMGASLGHHFGGSSHHWCEHFKRPGVQGHLGICNVLQCKALKFHWSLLSLLRKKTKRYCFNFWSMRIYFHIYLIHPCFLQSVVPYL